MTGCASFLHGNDPAVVGGSPLEDGLTPSLGRRELSAHGTVAVRWAGDRTDVIDQGGQFLRREWTDPSEEHRKSRPALPLEPGIRTLPLEGCGIEDSA